MPLHLHPPHYATIEILGTSLVFGKDSFSLGVDHVGCDTAYSGSYLQMFSEEHFLNLEDASNILVWNVGKFLPGCAGAVGKIWCNLQPRTDVLLNAFLAYRPAVFCAAQEVIGTS